MFVVDNTIKSVKQYFFERLSNQFSHRELRMMFGLLVQKRLGVESSEVHFLEEQKLSESDLLYFRSAVKRLQADEPFQYIVNETEFYGISVYTDMRALIPRPETEELVDWVLKDIENSPKKIVDVCTGTGCIALALASKLKNASIFGIDVSEEALSLAKENANRLQFPVEFYNVDILKEKLPFPNESIDIIVSNPPYITESEKDKMALNVLNYEPHIALFVENEKALIFYEKIAKQALLKLKNGGSLYFEINESFGKETVDLLMELGFSSVELKKDLQDKDRMIKAIK
jgi:release factor glutamine methyltransferase